MAIVKKLDTPEGARKRLQIISPADMEGGTFTISNLGGIGEVWSIIRHSVKVSASSRSWSPRSTPERCDC